MHKGMLSQKSYCLAPAHGVRTQKEAMSISQYTVEILIAFIKEKVHSLLMFDVVEADGHISEELKNEIKKDGIVIYEKA